MVTEELARELLEVRTEPKNQDFKVELHWCKDNKNAKNELVKDILAFSNTKDGGYIVIGVRDEDYEFVGVSSESFKTIDTTKINDYLSQFTTPRHYCTVYKFKIDGKRLIVIQVPEFTDTPVICLKSAHSSDEPNRLVLQAGAIYVRTERGASAAVDSAETMRELLGRGLTRKRNELLGSIEQLIKGKSKEVTAKEKPYDDHLLQSLAFFNEHFEKLGSDKGYWQVMAYPTSFVANRIRGQAELRRLIRENRIQSRPFGFPFFHEPSNAGDTSNIAAGWQSITEKSNLAEWMRVYFNGFFSWRGIFWEDLSSLRGSGRRELDFARTIILVTDYFTFLKRYFDEIAPNEEAVIELRLCGTAGRYLVYLGENPMIDWPSDKYIAAEDVILFRERLTTAELQAGSNSVANRAIDRIFHLFNKEDFPQEAIDSWRREYPSK